ncbi:MAG: bacterioferritin [Gammaproteobacteria bacterium]|nr:bacterioferritin [Gammaproteobacteria bacterium]
MYVCICKAITDADIREAAESGVADVEHLTETLGVGGGCGTCLEVAESIIDACRVNQLSYAA